jgi:diadenosine tetraphosphate (Ap4A) HIT family hydrolase
MEQFELDKRLNADTFSVAKLGLCELRLMNDRRWPWLILVPRRPGLAEIHDMTPLDQTMLTFELGIVAQALKTVTGCQKINTGGPVWGFGTRETYDEKDARQLIADIRTAL